MKKVTFAYAGAKTQVLNNVELKIQRGVLACVFGPGTGSFLRILGQMLIPTEGEVFHPPHLRILHVSKVPQLLRDTIANNVFLGVLKANNAKTAKDLPQDVFERGVAVCRKLFGGEKRMMDLVQNVDDDTSRECKSLTHSEKQLIHFARALIFNPEVLVAHTPGVYFDSEFREVTFKLMKAFVTEKGLEMDPATNDLRRMRTYIFSTTLDKEHDHEDVDVTIELTAGGNGSGEFSQVRVSERQRRCVLEEEQLSETGLDTWL